MTVRSLLGKVMGLRENLSVFSVNLTEDTWLNFTSATTDLTLNRTTDDECTSWLEAQHVLLQLANLCLAIGFLCPSTFMYHSHVKRLFLAMASLFIVIWSAAVVCHPDVLGWNIVFLLINLFYLCHAVYSIYPSNFHPELEDVYQRLFAPLRVTRSQFKELTSLAQLKDLPHGATYALEGATHAGEKLSILLSGRLKITRDDLILHTIEPNQFVDSLEYEAVIATPPSEEEETYQMSIRSIEDSRLVTWPAKELYQYLKTKPYLHAIMNNLQGKDITHKLYQVQELLLQNAEYVKLITGRNSIVHMRHQLSQGASPHNANGFLRQMSPDSIHSYSSGSRSSGRSFGRPRVATPVGPYSPSQVSFETCV